MYQSCFCKSSVNNIQCAFYKTLLVCIFSIMFHCIYKTLLVCIFQYGALQLNMHTKLFLNFLRAFCLLGLVQILFLLYSWYFSLFLKRGYVAFTLYPITMKIILEPSPIFKCCFPKILSLFLLLLQFYCISTRFLRKIKAHVLYLPTLHVPMLL